MQVGGVVTIRKILIRVGRTFLLNAVFHLL